MQSSQDHRGRELRGGAEHLGFRPFPKRAVHVSRIFLREHGEHARQVLAPRQNVIPAPSQGEATHNDPGYESHRNGDRACMTP
jgi:hypothetical protein